MKTKFFLTATALFLILNVIGQKSAIKLAFTAIDSLAYMQIDSIKIINRTQGGDTILYWPDTVLVMDNQLGIIENSDDFRSMQLFQNYPNPVADQTTISFYVPDNDKVDIIITDVLGRVMIKTEQMLEKGYHSFRFKPGNGSPLFFTVLWRGNRSSIKILNATSYSKEASSLEYLGSEGSSPQLKATEEIQSFVFSIGDELVYIGSANSFQSGMLDVPEKSETYTFQFATNIPCPGMPMVEYEGQVYNTIQIFSQCWLKENLNLGWMIPGGGNMTDNGFIEKYCYSNEPDSCDKYGGLYQWDEMMQYTTQQGIQGICPQGWHVPTDEEWKILEGAVESQYAIGDPVWDLTWHRGFDAGANLKTISGWNDGGNGTDEFGFSGLPGGSRDSYGGFGGGGGSIGINGHWWTSTESNSVNTWYRHLDHDISGISRYEVDKLHGFSVRCVRDN